MSELYYKHAEGFIAIFDLTKSASIDNLIFEIEFLLGCRNTFKIPLIILGSKSDLLDKRQVSYSDGENVAKRFNAQYFEMSSKNKINIFEPVNELVRFSLFRDVKNNLA